MTPRTAHSFWAPASLGSSVIAAAAILAVELSQPPPEFPAPAVELLPTVGAANVTDRPATVVTALDERPLFTPSRRPIKAEGSIAMSPPPPPPPAPPPPPPPPPDARAGLTLVGILNGPDDRIALIKINGSGEVQRLTEGEMVDRWQLQQIFTDHILLSIQGATQQLDFPPPAEGRSRGGGARLAGMPQPHPPRHP